VPVLRCGATATLWGAPSNARDDDRYRHLPVEKLPWTEFLDRARQRVAPYWLGPIAADLRSGPRTLVVAHGATLRALCMHLDGLTPERC
jgi:2,3-bisphosphoglycerate-dependent phosphoglycerate mutase